MAGEKRIAFMDSEGNVLECSVCFPEYAPEWAAMHGYAKWEDMDALDGKVKYVAPGDKFDESKRQVVKDGGKAAFDAFVEARALDLQERHRT